MTDPKPVPGTKRHLLFRKELRQLIKDEMLETVEWALDHALGTKLSTDDFDVWFVGGDIQFTVGSSEKLTPIIQFELFPWLKEHIKDEINCGSVTEGPEHYQNMSAQLKAIAALIDAKLKEDA